MRFRVDPTGQSGDDLYPGGRKIAGQRSGESAAFGGSGPRAHDRHRRDDFGRELSLHVKNGRWIESGLEGRGVEGVVEAHDLESTTARLGNLGRGPPRRLSALQEAQGRLGEEILVFARMGEDLAQVPTFTQLTHHPRGYGGEQGHGEKLDDFGHDSLFSTLPYAVSRDTHERRPIVWGDPGLSRSRPVGIFCPPRGTPPVLGLGRSTRAPR